MGNLCVKYFLHFAEQVKGRAWIDQHIYAFYAGEYALTLKISHTLTPTHPYIYMRIIIIHIFLNANLMVY